MNSSGQSRVIVDVEITTWPGTWERSWNGPNEKREIVQIGALKFDPHSFAVLETFEVLVRPTHNPQLSALFTELTGITQAQVDAQGLPFADAFTRFAAFRGDLPLHTYGGHRFGGDTAVFAANFEYNNMPKPADWPNNERCNLKPWFVRHAPETETANSGKLVKVLGLREPMGEHTGLADCHSILTAMQHLVQAKGCPRPY